MVAEHTNRTGIDRTELLGEGPTSMVSAVVVSSAERCPCGNTGPFYLTLSLLTWCKTCGRKWL